MNEINIREDLENSTNWINDVDMLDPLNPRNMLIDNHWITTEIKRLIKKQNRFYKNFQRKGCKPQDKEAVDNFRNECFNAINIAKENYLTNHGKQLNDPKTGTKAYWKVLNKLLNKSNIPIIPPILYNNKFITSFAEKANLFNEYFFETM